jgi:hypothetical protein
MHSTMPTVIETAKDGIRTESGFAWNVVVAKDVTPTATHFLVDRHGAAIAAGDISAAVTLIVAAAAAAWLLWHHMPRASVLQVPARAYAEDRADTAALEAERAWRLRALKAARQRREPPPIEFASSI